MNSAVCIFSLFWSIPGLRKNKSLDRKQVLLRQADVKQKCCKASVTRTKSFLTISNDLWLIIT